jgi:UDP-3-O-[3-hydroxymyristoyl] glucosamine N-acyltransferase
MLSVAELAHLCDAEVLGIADRPIAAVAPLNIARARDIAWIGDATRVGDVAASNAGAVLVPHDVNRAGANSALVICNDPVAALALVIEALERQSPTPGWIPDGGGLVDATAQLGTGTFVSPNVVIGAAVTVGSGSWLGPGCVIESGVELGEGCHVGAGSIVGAGTRIGNHCRIGAGAIVGSAPDAYHWHEGGMKPVPAFGVAILSDYVVVGPGTQVQRAVEGVTMVGEHTMIGSQCLIGHDCRIGAHAMIGGQSGVGAGCEVGNHVVISVQVGINVGITIGERARIGPRSGVLGDVPAGETWLGAPAVPKLMALKQFAILRRLTQRSSD